MQVEKRRIEAIEKTINRTACEIRGAQGHWTKQFEDVQKRIDEQDVQIAKLNESLDAARKAFQELQKKGKTE